MPGGSADSDAEINTSAGYHWRTIARNWQQVGAPLRPSDIDLRIFQSEIDKWCTNNAPPRVLILGVTPEIYQLPWPDRSDIHAVDHTQGMIDAVWPGLASEVTCGEWTRLPLAPGSRDIALCDGGFHLLRNPDEQLALVNSLAGVLRPDGVFILRLFVPPGKQEDPQDVLQELQAGRIRDLNILKLRLGMALQKQSSDGVELRKVWELIHSLTGDFSLLAKQLDWPLEHLLAINSYKDSKNRYYFVSVEETVRMFTVTSNRFKLKNIHWPEYELGERCPIVVLNRCEG